MNYWGNSKQEHAYSVRSLSCFLPPLCDRSWFVPGLWVYVPETLWFKFRACISFPCDFCPKFLHFAGIYPARIRVSASQFWLLEQMNCLFCIYCCSYRRLRSSRLDRSFCSSRSRTEELRERRWILLNARWNWRSAIFTATLFNDLPEKQG